MTIKVGLISDVHATVAPVKEAFEIFNREKTDIILCAGDIAGYGDELDETIELLKRYKCKAIKGNHDIWYMEKNETKTSSLVEKYLQDLPLTVELEVEDRKILMVHAHPPDAYTGGIRLLDEKGMLMTEQIINWHSLLENYDYDVIVIGHTHQVFNEMIANTLVINPGSSKFNHSCAILELPEMKVNWHALSGEKIAKVWNWSSQFSNR
ncbi:MAG: metallophosphatase family protein [Gammaproteobacteria bacterium]|nr:metallophosphatase family protein [Gammaproteobacteria bacterium]MDH5735302.1 metallophosphatase family protein [Gammaproteobacteria bacterium]